MRELAAFLFITMFLILLAQDYGRKPESRRGDVPTVTMPRYGTVAGEWYSSVCIGDGYGCGNRVPGMP